MRIAICDDNELERRKLELFLKRLQKEEQLTLEINGFDSGDALLSAYKNGDNFDILFLDIYMEGTSGLSVAKTLSEEGFTGSVIFCTSSAEHAVDSYKLKADGYILKPFEYSDFVDAIWRCRERFDENKKSLHFRAERIEYSLPLSDIYYIETKTRGCGIHTSDKEFITYKKISDFEEELKSELSYMRLGRSFLVNLSNAERCDEDCLVLKNGEEIPLPCREKTKYRQMISNYLVKK